MKILYHLDISEMSNEEQLAWTKAEEYYICACPNHLANNKCTRKEQIDEGERKEKSYFLMNIVLTNLTDYAKNNLIGTWHLNCSKLLVLSCSSYKAFVKTNLFCWIGEPELYFSIVLVGSKFHICSLLILCASSLFQTSSLVFPSTLKS